MSVELLSEEEKENLAKNVKMNGGIVDDNDFEDLENYLKMNPRDSEIFYLDN